MSRETHVRFWERAAVKLRRATRLVVMGESHLRRILRNYAAYYNRSRTHRALRKDCPVHRPIQMLGEIRSISILGGLHHIYSRI